MLETARALKSFPRAKYKTWGGRVSPHFSHSLTQHWRAWVGLACAYADGLLVLHYVV